MFDSDRKYDEEYVDPQPIPEKKRIGWRDVTPMWALPLLLIPLALLVWGGSLLLPDKNDTNSQTLTKEANATNQNTSQNTGGTELGVGGSGNTASPTVTPRRASTTTPTSSPSAQVGVGGGPEDEVQGTSGSVPGTPNTGHGW